MDLRGFILASDPAGTHVGCCFHAPHGFPEDPSPYYHRCDGYFLAHHGPVVRDPPFPVPADLVLLDAGVALRSAWPLHYERHRCPRHGNSLGSHCFLRLRLGHHARGYALEGQACQEDQADPVVSPGAGTLVSIAFGQMKKNAR